MASKREITEARLRDSLQRLLHGFPNKTKVSGLLTLNKINKEAGLGNSYIFKFPDFIEFAKPLIDEFNASKSKALNDEFSIPGVHLTKEEQLKAELNKEKRLKERYRQERDDARKAKADLEVLNNTLMYRVFELQEELRSKSCGKIVDISN